MESKTPRFPTTDWSMLRRAADRAAPGHDDSLDLLLRRYMPIIQDYLMLQKRLPAERAEELVQAFVADKLIASRLLAQADRTRGRFRNLLLRSLENFLIDRHRRSKASISIAEVGVAQAAAVAAGAESDPTFAFDKAWAQSVMDEALRRTKQRCEQTKRTRIWEAFEFRVLQNVDDPPSYPELVARFGFASPAKAANALVTARRMFTRMLKQVLAEFAGPGVDLKEELQDLRKILGSSAAL